MTLSQIPVLKSFACRTGAIGLLAFLTFACAGGQRLDLTVRAASASAVEVRPLVAAEPGEALGPVEGSSPLIDVSTESSSLTSAAVESLPESPSSLLAASPSTIPKTASLELPFPDPGQLKAMDASRYPKTSDGRPIAPLYTKYIPPDWGYQPIHGREKLILGARDLYSPANILAIFVSSGYSHLINGQPNYGVNSEAFAKRLGATAIRETAEGIFTDGVFAVMFHQDPRYFAEGPKYGVVHRALYAATRPIIVRTTNGTGSTVNSSLLAGYAAAALLNNAYYPQINRNVKDTFSSYGTSIGGAALGFVVSEFTDDALQLLHLKHKP